MARVRRFFVANLDDHPVVLSGDEAHHLLHVMRLREGDPVALFDGKGRAVAATIVGQRGKTSVELAVGPSLPPAESELELELAVAVPKGERMRFIIEKLTELGAAAIWPLETERSEVSTASAAKRLSRWRRVALEACKQSGRARLPSIESPRPLGELLEGSRAEFVLMAQPGAPPLARRLAEAPSGRSVLALVGPEGGWSRAELELAASHQVPLFSLGPRTLRTDTACVVVAALLQWCSGDLNSPGSGEERNAKSPGRKDAKTP